MGSVDCLKIKKEREEEESRANQRPVVPPPSASALPTNLGRLLNDKKMGP